MRHTTLLAYKEILPKLPERRLEVLNAIIKSENGLTNEEIGIIVKRPTHHVSTRCTELEKMGLISSDKVRESKKTGRLQVVWSYVENPVLIEFKPQKKNNLTVLNEKIENLEITIAFQQRRIEFLESKLKSEAN